ncbi:DNA-directed RNA polymerase subunit alpha [Candidatus Dojkabacteria bacterium]|nr:DNA-directed RNA polymerase subunit alpha [Candidatus Dojkabacteria bacterium]
MSLFDDVKVTTKQESAVKAKIEVTNLPSGYGYTLGSAVRRILLSSMEGVAVVGVRITGVTHEFSTIKGVKEGVFEILLNLKRVKFKIDGADEATGVIKFPKSGVVTAKDITVPSNVTIANPDQKIAEISKLSGSVKFDLDIKRGIGYNHVELVDRNEIGYIPLDADFSPIRRVDMDVEKVRFGERTDLDKVSLVVVTDNSVEPLEAVKRSIGILVEALSTFGEILKNEKEDVAEPTEVQEESGWNIENIDIPTKVRNVLIAAGVKTLDQLTKLTVADVMEIQGLGAKAVKEIEKALKKIGLTLAK